MSVVSLPDVVKPATCREATSVCNCRALRGAWGEHAQKDAQRNLGDPLRPDVMVKG